MLDFNEFLEIMTAKMSEKAHARRPGTEGVKVCSGEDSKEQILKAFQLFKAWVWRMGILHAFICFHSFHRLSQF